MLTNIKKRVAIIGGGPSGLFLFKRLTESPFINFTVDIFEQKTQLGQGMPYSCEGSGREHITNVSGNEIPELVTTVVDWIDTVPDETLKKYTVDRETFHEFKVLPRLLFGEYLNAQFNLLLARAKEKKITTNIHLACKVADVIDKPGTNEIIIETGDGEKRVFDHVIICTGHNWPKKHEVKVPGYFDSPYPPVKLNGIANHPVAIRGSSLTAIDAVRTLARNNGVFIEEAPHKLLYKIHDGNDNFKIVMHSRGGLLPGIRFHLDDPRLSNKSLLTKKEIAEHIKANGGFLSLDFIFEKDFIAPFKDKDPEFYKRIKGMRMEEFVGWMMGRRENIDPFILFKSEYAEAQKSIKQEQSVYWKEMLAVLSFAMNYPAKHFSAEDMLRLKKVLMPLISIVIAFVPQTSCEEMIALHACGRLQLISVGEDSGIKVTDDEWIIYHYTDEGTSHYKETAYQTFIDCIGQPHLSKEAFPFKSLLNNGNISDARLPFQNDEQAKQLVNHGNEGIEQSAAGYFLKVPGIAIDDTFRIIDTKGEKHQRIYIMAVSYIGGFNPDYSGLDFCEEASKTIANDILRQQ